MALKECDIEQLVMNLTMPEVVTDLPLPTVEEKVEKKKKMRTREKIEKLVSEGAKNYPAYLKLVHTGDSDFSDNEEMERIVKTRHNRDVRNYKMEDDQQAENENNEKVQDKNEDEIENKTENKSGNKKSGRKWSFKRRWLKLSPGTPGEEKKDPVKDTPTSEKDEDENIYSSSEMYDNVANANLPSPDIDPEEKARMEGEWRDELAKLEEEILTLKQVLNAKVRHSADLKRKLGITPMREFQADIKQGFQNIKESDAYKKTSETLSSVNASITESETYKKTSAKLSEFNQAVSSSPAFQKTNQAFKSAGTKTSNAFSSFGAFTSRKLGDVRNSNTFKSFEERLGGAYTNVKHSRSLGNIKSRMKMTRMSGSQSEQNFGEALINDGQEMKNASASMPATPVEEKKEPLS